MNLVSYKVEKGSRKKIFDGLIRHYETLIANDGPSSEAFYWLGVAENDCRLNKEEALEYFIYSTMIMHDYERFKELYRGEPQGTYN